MSFRTSLLFILGELAVGGSLAVAVGFSDRSEYVSNRSEYQTQGIEGSSGDNLIQGFEGYLS